VIGEEARQPSALHKLVIVAVARRLVTIANAILKTGVPWRQNLAT
jgi:transposase